jgi:cystathionine beta-synthase
MESGQVSDLMESRARALVSATVQDTVGAVIGRMKSDNISQMPVVDDQGVLSGMISEVDLLNYLLSGAGGMDHAICDIISSEVRTVRPESALDTLAEIAGAGMVAVVVDESGRPTGIVTKIDLIDYLANKVR